MNCPVTFWVVFPGGGGALLPGAGVGGPFPGAVHGVRGQSCHQQTDAHDGRSVHGIDLDVIFHTASLCEYSDVILIKINKINLKKFWFEIKGIVYIGFTYTLIYNASLFVLTQTCRWLGATTAPRCLRRRGRRRCFRVPRRTSTGWPSSG